MYTNILESRLAGDRIVPCLPIIGAVETVCMLHNFVSVDVPARGYVPWTAGFFVLIWYPRGTLVW